MNEIRAIITIKLLENQQNHLINQSPMMDKKRLADLQAYAATYKNVSNHLQSP